MPAQQAGEAQDGEQDGARKQETRAARPDRRPRTDEPFGAGIVAAPHNDHRQEPDNNRGVIFLFQHAAKLRQNLKVATVF